MRQIGAMIVVVLLASCAAKRSGGDVDAATGGGDTNTTGGGGDGGDGTIVYVYAHTSSTLYRVDPDTLAITMIGAFQWPNGFDQMTDIAVDKDGGIVGVSFGSVYKVDPLTAKCTLLSSSLSGSFNGLSFVPADMLGLTGNDVLVGSRNDDDIIMRIDPMTGAATQVGRMGGGYQSSGDLVAISGFGTAQTVLGAPSDKLVKLAPNTFAATPVGASGTGFGQIWGVAYWKGKVFGFTEQGQFLTIDPTTGVATLVQGGGPAWWGAGVTTIAPVLQ